jgi:hypothetical protein
MIKAKLREVLESLPGQTVSKIEFLSSSTVSVDSIDDRVVFIFETGSERKEIEFIATDCRAKIVTTQIVP